MRKWIAHERGKYFNTKIDTHSLNTQKKTSISIYLSIFIRPITDNLNAIGHAVGQDSETKSTEHRPKYKQSTVIKIQVREEA